eukprot:g30655.t1
MGSQELVQHKTILVMQSIADPKRLQGAVGNLWSAYLAVIATLSLKFAQTTAYALAISEMVKFPVTRVVAPPLAYALGSNLVNWVDVIIDSTLKAIVILLVWFFARIRPSTNLPYWNAEGIFGSTGFQRMGRGAKKLPGSQALGLPGEQKAGHHEPLHAGEVSESEEDTDRGGFRINHLQEDKVLLPTSNGRPGVKLKKGVPGGCSRIPLTNAQRNRRKQPKQGDVAVASALQMSATIRRQLLQVCHQAGLSPPPLQVHSPEASEVPGSPVELDEPKLLRRSRPALAAQLRRATLVRAERERQRRSRAVQTVQSMPEVSIKMNQDAPLIPKSVELEGYEDFLQRQAGVETQLSQQAQLESSLGFLESTRRAQQQLLQQFQYVDEEVQRSRQAFEVQWRARELQRQEEAEALERERLEREQSILERQREMCFCCFELFSGPCKGCLLLRAAGWTDAGCCNRPDLPEAWPFNPDESYLDEVIGYPLALVGFYFQMTHYFGVLPFPLDWLLWPLSFVEGLLEIQISW